MVERHGEPGARQFARTRPPRPAARRARRSSRRRGTAPPADGRAGSARSPPACSSEPAHWNATSSRRAHEQHAGRAVHDLGRRRGSRACAAPMKRVRRGQRVDAAHPFAPVVVAVAEEIIDHDASGSASARSRRSAAPRWSGRRRRSAIPRRRGPIRRRRGGTPRRSARAPSRKMPLTTRVELWNTTSRETWMSIAQRRLRAAAMAISGAASIDGAGARPSNSGARRGGTARRRHRAPDRTGTARQGRRRAG